MLLSLFDTAPRRLLAWISAVCVALLAFGLYLQHGVGLEPCPMCIVQRYALVLVAVVAGLTALSSKKGPLKRAIPMIFKGSGDCTKIDWTFLGLSIANWSFISFGVIALVALMLVVRQAGRR
ncbi:MAG: hypothetical protein B7Y03_13895 [Polaromonas sp. 24-62-144]|nr:MAG: hypothetical protein B7Y03_13895 [Polaromonas sp. 24-62-144]